MKSLIFFFPENEVLIKLSEKKIKTMGTIHKFDSDNFFKRQKN